VAGTLVLAALLPATAAMAQSMAPSGGSPALEGTNWQLTNVAGAADGSAIPSMKADLVLQGDTASGFGGCNHFTTTYTLDGSALSFGEPTSTMMACDEALMSFESVYLGALPTVAGYQITGDTLELLNGTGSAALTYSAGPGGSAPGAETALVGAWTATGINNGAEAVVSVPEDPALTAVFAADGSVSGFGGCNQYGGPYVAAGDTIGIGPLHQTMMACGDPADTTEQQFLAALTAATVWSLRGGTLELRDDSGALQVSLVAAAPVSSPSAS
jgi:heat shock protein HslJ